MDRFWIASIATYICLILAGYFYLNGDFYLVFIFVVIGIAAALAKIYFKEKLKNPTNLRQETEVKTLSNLGKKRK